MENTYALITGASTGIGFELSKILALNNYNLILVARDEKRLNMAKEEIVKEYNVKVEIMVKDLSNIEKTKEIYNELKGKDIEILINNAGFGTYGEFYNIPLDEDVNMLNVNITSLTILTKLFLQDMLSKKKGHILNVASTAAFEPGPLMSTYFASKAYVLSFSQALYNETKDSGVCVSVLCPGATKTEFEKRANMGESRLFKTNVMKAKDVAQIGFDGMMENKRVIIAGMQNNILSFMTRFLPTSLLMAITKNLVKRG